MKKLILSCSLLTLTAPAYKAIIIVMLYITKAIMPRLILLMPLIMNDCRILPEAFGPEALKARMHRQVVLLKTTSHLMVMLTDMIREIIVPDLNLLPHSAMPSMTVLMSAPPIMSLISTFMPGSNTLSKKTDGP